MARYPGSVRVRYGCFGGTQWGKSLLIGPDSHDTNDEDAGAVFLMLGSDSEPCEYPDIPG